jgi:hypothetical protein
MPRRRSQKNNLWHKNKWIRKSGDVLNISSLLDLKYTKGEARISIKRRSGLAHLEWHWARLVANPDFLFCWWDHHQRFSRKFYYIIITSLRLQHPWGHCSHRLGLPVGLLIGRSDSIQIPDEKSKTYLVGLRSFLAIRWTRIRRVARAER